MIGTVSTAPTPFKTTYRPAAEGFGSTLRGLREARRWSQDRAADACDVDHSSFSRIEAGVREPTVEYVAKISAGFRLPAVAAARLYLLAGYAPPALAALEPTALAGLLHVIDNPERLSLLTILGSMSEARLRALLVLLHGDADGLVGGTERGVAEPGRVQRGAQPERRPAE